MIVTLLEFQFDEELENICVRKYFPEIFPEYMLYWNNIDHAVNKVYLLEEGHATVFWFKNYYKIKPKLSFYFSHNVLGTQVCLSRDNLEKELFHMCTIYEANTRFVCYDPSRNCCLYAGKLIKL